MDEDLFEEEGEEKSSEAEEPEVFDDEDEVEDLDLGDELEEVNSEDEDEDAEEEEVELGDDLKEITPEDEDEDAEEEEIDIGDEVEEIATEEDDEGEASSDDDETDMEDDLEEEPSDDEEEESDDGDASWIPLEDDELEAISDDEEEDDFLDDDETDMEDDLEEEPSDDEDEELEDAPSGTIDINNIIEEEGIDIDDAEVPPWDEEVEIPLHDTTGSEKKKNLFIYGGLFFLIALIGASVYIFFESKKIAETPVLLTENEKKATFVTRKMSDIKLPDTVPDKTPMKKVAPAGPVVKENTIPTIIGEPAITAHEGVPYSFIPKSNDADLADNLTFFIANQPVWTDFDTSTGALTGTPRKDDVGAYEKIAIMVSDGRATASLPIFNLTVIGAIPVETQKKKVEPPAIVAKQKPKAEVNVKPEPVKKTPPPKPQKKKAVPKKAETDPYALPVLTDLIKQSEFQDAAIEYHKNVREVPKAYSLKLEVDCVEESVEVAFKNGNYNREMFILPINIKGKGCFIVFWGLYKTKWQALNALKTIPTYFKNQATKPQLIVVKQYL